MKKKELFPSTRVEIPLNRIDVGTSQVSTDQRRLSDVMELAANINKVGLLHPIVVEQKSDGRYEILAGQRRFLAHKALGRQGIKAEVHEGPVDETWKKVISLSENLARHDNTQRENIDACTYLYRRYGSIKLVAESTGLSKNKVSKYVKFDQLIKGFKEMVAEGEMEMNVALQAQRAATEADGTIDEDAAEVYAAEMRPMSNQQRNSLLQIASSDPTATVEEKIERHRCQPVRKQVLVTLEDQLHSALKAYASTEGLNQDEAAAALIEDGLARYGSLEES